MKKALADLFSSKKFLVMIVAIISYITARIGWDVNPETINTVMQVVAGYLVGQGIADHGKEAAKVTAAAAADAAVAVAGTFLDPKPRGAVVTATSPKV